MGTVIPDELIEAAARGEHEYLGTFGTPGARHACPPAIHERHVASGDPCDGYWIEGEQPSWEDEDENIREMHREDVRRVLSAAFEVREPCATCEGHGYLPPTAMSAANDVHELPCPTCDGSGQGERVIDKWLRETRLEQGTEHVIRFTDDGWTIQHPLAERLDGSLFDCEWNRHAHALDGPPNGVTGDYVATLNEDGVPVYRFSEREEP